jgi:GAF domain-containing protein
MAASPSTTASTEKQFMSVDALAEALREVNDDGSNEWELTNFDVETTIPPTLEAEVERLHVLQSYNILDSDAHEAEFSSITQEAKIAFDVPIVLVSFVDLGRQWFKSKQGLDAEETPRSCAFCAHVIQRKEQVATVMVVPDATKDVRFQDNPLVTGGLKVRFYAGAPLISPEGPKLGTLCLLDTKPRPEGLTKAEQRRLSEMAAEVVFNMVSRCGD